MADFNEKFDEIKNTPDTTAEYDQTDISNNKFMAILSYLGILFLIPRFAAKQSKYAQYHANQGHTLAIFDLACIIITTLLGLIKTTHYVWGIPYQATPWYISLICWLIRVPAIVLSIIGIVNAAKGQAKELPIIGKFKFLK